MEWNNSQKKCFHRLISGLIVADLKGEDVRFFTLTTSKDSDFSRLKRDFTVLKLRIERKYGRINYLKVRTSEGNGTLHVVYRGPFIPQKWLSDSWNDIHDSPIVDIRLIRNGPKRIARYVVSQYLANQGSRYVGYSFSPCWIFKGAIKEWERLRYWFRGSKLYSIWNCFIFINVFPQSVIEDFVER